MDNTSEALLKIYPSHVPTDKDDLSGSGSGFIACWSINQLENFPYTL